MTDNHVVSSKRITDKRAAAIAPPKTGYRLIQDSYRGLSLRITAPSRTEPKGARAWVFTYWPKHDDAGRQRRMTIGRIEDWPVKAARARVSDLQSIVDAGGDPLKDRQDAREALTVDQLADRYVEEHFPRLGLASQESYEVLLRRWIRPELGGLKVADVGFTDIDRLHRKITKAGTPYTANRTVTLLRHLFKLANKWQVRGDGVNPAKDVAFNPEAKRERYLDDDELDRLMRALANHKHPSAAAVRLLLLTGARRSEVLRATFDQFDLTKGVWTKPSSHTKQKKTHRVPLSAPARQIIAGLYQREIARAKKEKRDPSKLLFPSRGRDTPQRQLKSFWRTICAEAKLTNLRVHDLRHSYASSLVNAGLSLPTIGALLGHTQAATTHRYAHLSDAALRAATDRRGAEITAAAAKTKSKTKKKTGQIVTLHSG